MLNALAAVVGFRVGLDFAAGGLQAEQGAHGALGLAHHEVGLGDPFQCVRRRAIGRVGEGLAVLGAGGCLDEKGGELEFGGVVGLEGGDLGDGGFVSVFPFRFGAGWREGAAELAGEVAVGAFEEGVGGFGG